MRRLGQTVLPNVLPLLAIALLWATACGGADPETPEDPEAAGTTGGEDPPDAAPEPALDPCAPSDEAPCEGEATRDLTIGEGGEDPGAEPAEEGTTEATEVEDPEEALDPRTAWRQMVGRGRGVFVRACDTCHPDGEEDLGPDIRGKRLPVARVIRQIRRGVGRMRPIPPSRLPDQYMDDLMAFLSTIGTVRGVQRPQ